MNEAVSPGMERLLNIMASAWGDLSDSEDDNVLANLFDITDAETEVLALAILTQVADHPVPVVLGFTAGCVLGERVGYARAMEER